MFAYPNLQNLHLSNLMSASVPAGETYPGFHAPDRRAGPCHRIGVWADSWSFEQRDAYDRSVIVLTSDHGELPNEEGRWGHVLSFPQILAFR